MPCRSNYGNSGPSACEPFTVGPGSSSVVTVVNDAATNAPWSGTEATGASAYDTATVTLSDGAALAGTVNYTFSTNGNCSGSGASAGSGAVSGTGPGAISAANSSTEGPLAAGSYSLQATCTTRNPYTALSRSSACEPFTVGPGSSSVVTVVNDAATNAPWSGTE